MLKLKIKKLSNIEKIVGLIFAKKPYSIYFKTRFGIHTFGMKFPIDVIILNKANRVVKMNQNMKPNKIYFWPIIYEDVLELPQGMILTNNIAIGQQIELVFI
ncbi:MAG TPA: DUF192 domain-containing protein [Candidatus Limnocylindrales bacterium]|nr:DUF192 domain-containing protein [Candidatus Limnocylindrales bacterium]